LARLQSRRASWPIVFAQIAAEHRRLLEDVKSLRVNDPEVQALRQQAAAALEIADHAAASARLAEARTIVTTKRQMLARVLDDQKREEAVLVFEQARVELARLAYEQAAQLFAEATRLLPPGDIETRWTSWKKPEPSGGWGMSAAIIRL